MAVDALLLPRAVGRRDVCSSGSDYRISEESPIMKPTEHVSVPALALRAAPGTLGCSLQPRRPVRNALWLALWPSGRVALRACAALGHCSTGTGASVCTPASIDQHETDAHLWTECHGTWPKRRRQPLSTSHSKNAETRITGATPFPHRLE